MWGAHFFCEIRVGARISRGVRIFCYTRTGTGTGKRTGTIGDNRVFPKVDHSARSDRIVLVKYTIGSVVELNFCSKFAKDLAKI